MKISKKRLFASFLLFFLISNMFLAMSLASETSYASPLSYWKLDDETIPIHDEMGNHNGSLRNGGEYVEGVDGKAIEFDGEDDWIEVQDQSTLNPENFSITLWVKFNEFQTQGIIGKAGNGQSHLSQELGWTIEMSSGSLKFWIWDSPSWKSASWTHDLALNEWYFISMIFNGTGIKAYVNASLVGELNGINNYQASNQSMHFGSIYPYEPDGSAVMGNLNGTLDEIALFNSSLSDESIVEIYENGITLPEEEEDDPYPTEVLILMVGVCVIIGGIATTLIIVQEKFKKRSKKKASKRSKFS